VALAPDRRNDPVLSGTDRIVAIALRLWAMDTRRSSYSLERADERPADAGDALDLERALRGGHLDERRTPTSQMQG
jgi:hypothetical protein